MLDVKTLLPYSFEAGRIFTVMPEGSSFKYHEGINYVLIRFTDSARDILRGRTAWARQPVPSPIGLVHNGYWQAAQRIVPHVYNNMVIGRPLVFCGYSRGGALSAMLCAIAHNYGLEATAYAVAAPACMQAGAHQDTCNWWISRDDELAYAEFGAPFERDGVVHEFNGPRHLPASGYFPYL